MKLTKIFSGLAIFIVVSLSLAGCGGSQSSGSDSSSNNLTFWSGSNPPEMAFWTEMAKEYTAKNPSVKIAVKPIPESPTSEAGIQAALAGNTAPTSSEGIFTGFGSQLSQSQALVPLDQMPGWDNVLKARHMENTIQGWKFSDGHSYILPMYSNAIMVAWRMDILKQLGYSQPPHTYSEVLALGQKLKAKFPDKYVWARPELAKDTWYERWFDFFTLYDAATNGNSFISGGKVTADDQAAVSTLSLLQQMSQKKYLLAQTITDPFENGNSVMSIIGPWAFTTWQQKYPNLQLNKSYVLTSPIVPDNMASTQNVKTFADSKGIVIYKQASEAQQQAIWKFVSWVLSDPQHDLTWLKTTALPPARDDLSTNSAFTSYLKQHPELVAFTDNIANGVPPIKNGKYADIQQKLGADAVIPAVKGQASPQNAWNAFKSDVQSSLGGN
ncbi:extracellular solute-binding protein [Dictyobacter kobayashii]|uniref:Sugar ABC transporter substrate-binding protein n=1 Tax=Dictyobacter kobayashii TaxID=2014872 RepID=A0A402AT43_9CHLR|nr:extracellular solute-binding protein [Dictyobacter kobayashii]GCE22267.1 sugar ABC transporter substrate-binding protein [Dictyobacter kobayashii]